MSTGRRSPGRPAGFDRDEALDALMNLFWSRGYDGATQEGMRATTGLSSSSLYRTFGTKADTFEAALRRYLELADGMLQPLETGSAGVADLHALLDRVAARLGGSHGTAGCMVVAVVQDPVNHDPRVSALTSRHLARMRRAIADAAERAERAGEPLPSAPHEFADAFFAAVLGILVSARSGDRDTALALIHAVRALTGPRPHSSRVGSVGPTVDIHDLAGHVLGGEQELHGVSHVGRPADAPEG